MSTYQIAIDPGVHTGLAVAKDGVLVDVRTCSFWEAHWQVSSLLHVGEKVELVIEDPRGQRVSRSDDRYGPHRLKGVGSVERDAKLWIEYAEHCGIPYRTVKPGKYRKIDADTFRKWTGWTGRTSEHSRCAAMMIFSKSKQG